MKSLLLVLAGLLFGALPARAEWNEPNIPEAREYRLFRFYPQARVMEYTTKDFDSVRLVTAYDKAAEEPATFEEIEGRVITYRTEHKPTTSPLEVLRNYQTVLGQQGFETIIAGRSPKGMVIGDDETAGVFRLKGDAGTIWVSVHGYYNATTPQSDVVIVEQGTLQQSLTVAAPPPAPSLAAPSLATSMATTLAATGHVAVYGITFDTGKASIRAESEPVLSQVLALLNADPALRLGIEGHTDSVGQPAANQRLSTDRAAAVKAWLVGRGIAAARLDPAGFGDTKPVADNATEEGKAKNRRVELVKR